MCPKNLPSCCHRQIIQWHVEYPTTTLKLLLSGSRRLDTVNDGDGILRSCSALIKNNVYYVQDEQVFRFMQ